MMQNIIAFVAGSACMVVAIVVTNARERSRVNALLREDGLPELYS